MIIVENNRQLVKSKIADKLNELYEEDLKDDEILVYDNCLELFNIEIVSNCSKSELIHIAEKFKESNFGANDIEEYLLHQSNIYCVENKWVVAKNRKPKNNALRKLKNEYLS